MFLNKNVIAEEKEDLHKVGFVGVRSESFQITELALWISRLGAQSCGQRSGSQPEGLSAEPLVPPQCPWTQHTVNWRIEPSPQEPVTAEDALNPSPTAASAFSSCSSLSA